MDLVIALSKLFTEKSYSILESQIGGDIDYWQSTVCSELGRPISSGFGPTRDVSRKIAIAELLERNHYYKCCNENENHKEWGLNIIGTACGFAAGFDEKNTVVRSIREATERWVMSKWIDEQFCLEEMDARIVVSNLDPVSRFLIKPFNEVRFFKKQVPLDVNGNISIVTVCKTMGLTEEGIFPGSSSQVGDGNFWQHALLESFRHFYGTKNNPNSVNIFPDNRVLFFSKNKRIALEQIEQASKSNWPTPEIIFHKVESFDLGYFISRTIIDGWEAWDKGPITRFLY